MIKSAVVLALALSSGAMGGVIQGHAYGSAFGAPFNRDPGQATECTWGGYGHYTLAGGCNYVSGGTIGQRVSGGPDWTLVHDQFLAILSSSVDSNGSLHAQDVLAYTNEPVDG